MDFEDPQQLLVANKMARTAYLDSVLTVSISATQAATTKDRPVTGPIWVSKFAVPKARENSNNNDARDLVLGLVDEANDGNVPYQRPDAAEALRFEWVGARAGVDKNAPEPQLDEMDKFRRLEAETTSPLTVLYIFGGLGSFNAPPGYRRLVGQLAQKTGSKILMVHQRLAPQNPFPAALVDVFQAYLTLLAAPPGSPHDPVPASSIVIAGDSSGAALALSLLQVILRLNRRNAAADFHGQEVMIEVPAGIALLSLHGDLSNSLPSHDRNPLNDIYQFPPVEDLPYLRKEFPTCAAWPANPPRVNLYCHHEMFMHPLVSPAAVDDWSGSCPMWIASGEEQCVDAVAFLAQRAHSQGVPVTFYEYQGMPHTFPLIFRQAPQTRKCIDDWAKAIVSFGKREKTPSSAFFVHAKGVKAEPRDVPNLSPFTRDEVLDTMRKKIPLYKVPAWHYREQASL
ncbi:hypothetical protein JDV02_010797 [Purpureocillium takamizusanense]|uniref:Alpha/beta hydrolase fold-3 domain-containing protein n=1 Tax=Purpureocillium takamizusanense TaxID=2060973 RepID=A0A9Q8QRB2_9HYPO|nr:uncharacterized protein JDV02_010797 [Purpureocillium takamizusanense]UNI25093.1 hypothetical protein JDV02_010797 [Purpureocillium takamizusanense]